MHGEPEAVLQVKRVGREGRNQAIRAVGALADAASAARVFIQHVHHRRNPQGLRRPHGDWLLAMEGDVELFQGIAAVRGSDQAEIAREKEVAHIAGDTGFLSLPQTPVSSP